jgi:hypothetical protein
MAFKIARESLGDHREVVVFADEARFPVPGFDEMREIAERIPRGDLVEGAVISPLVSYFFLRAPQSASAGMAPSSVRAARPLEAPRIQSFNIFPIFFPFAFTRTAVYRGETAAAIGPFRNHGDC